MDKGAKASMKLSVSTIFLFLTASALLVPSFVSGTSARPDSLLIYIVVPVICLWFSRQLVDQAFKPAILSFSILPLAIGAALLLQMMFLDGQAPFLYLNNFSGFLRIFLFALLAGIALSTESTIGKVVELLLWGTILHGFMTVVEYFDIEPLSALINLLYRGDASKDVGLRAVGAFQTVHSLAYYGVYSLLFSTTVALGSNNDGKKSTLAKMSVAAASVSLLLPFSRGAYLAAAAALLYMLFRPQTLAVLLKASASLSVCAVVILSSFERFRSYAMDVFTSFRVLLPFLLGDKSIIDDRSAGFIYGRLDWGWAHALQVWRANPLHGNILASQKLFIGDGGYTELLANSGLIGFVGFAAMLLALFISVRSPFRSSDHKTVVYRKGLHGMLIAMAVGNVATGVFRERTVELLPVFFLTLFALGARSTKEDQKV